MQLITLDVVLNDTPQFYKTRDGDVVALLDVIEQSDKQTRHYQVVAVNQTHHILSVSDSPFPRCKAGVGSQLLIQGQVILVPTETHLASPILIADSIALVSDDEGRGDVIEIPAEKQSIAFDRLDLDA